MMIRKSSQNPRSEFLLSAGPKPGFRKDGVTRRCPCELPENIPRFHEANDPELVLWLIGVHHGYGRPLFPHCDPLDERDRNDLVNVDGSVITLKRGAGPQSLAFCLNGRDWPQIFEDLKGRYGLWELSRLEAIVRLADHRASDDAGRRAADGGTL